MISTGLPYLQFSMNSQGFSPARLTRPAYDGGRKRENSSVWKHRIIVASTCRRSVEFGRYIAWLQERKMDKMKIFGKKELWAYTKKIISRLILL